MKTKGYAQTNSIIFYVKQSHSYAKCNNTLRLSAPPRGFSQMSSLAALRIAAATAHHVSQLPQLVKSTIFWHSVFLFPLLAASTTLMETLSSHQPHR